MVRLGFWSFCKKTTEVMCPPQCTIQGSLLSACFIPGDDNLDDLVKVVSIRSFTVKWRIPCGINIDQRGDAVRLQHYLQPFVILLCVLWDGGRAGGVFCSVYIRKADQSLL